MHNHPNLTNETINFKKSLIRLFKELKTYKALIILATILAFISAILSISSPSKLSNLTDEISSGLAINKTNMEILNKEILESYNQSNFKDIIFDNITITKEDQKQYMTFISSIKDQTDINSFYSKIDLLPKSIQEVLKPKMNINSIKNIAVFLVVIYVCSSLFNYIGSICMADISNKFARNLRGRISTKINKLPLSFFDKHQIGDTLSRITNDVDTIAQSMNHSLSSLVGAVCLFIGTLFMMFYTNFIMAITAILSSLIGFIGVTLTVKNSQKYFKSKQEELGNLNSHIESIYSSLNVVKAYNGVNNAQEEFDIYNKRVCEQNKKSQFLSGLMPPLMNFIGNFGYVAVCIVGAILAQKEIITFGVIVAFISYVRLFSNPLTQIAQGITQLQMAVSSSERVFEFLDEKELSNEENIKKYLDKTNVKGVIEFKNVNFGYDGNSSLTIKNFSATAHAGQKIAIVGPTGAGKTTMVNLLMKFYEINSGDILIDGVSINDLSRENIHELFTMVLQDSWLFEGTVKENIKYNKDISDDRIHEVCQEIGLEHFIKTLPDGYDSIISENDNISSGQRQLLTIARGMIEEAPFLILDEATSNVDTRTEELVALAMDKLTRGKTSFIIAHRLSTIKNADLILVMKDGNIIEQGNHLELMKKNGFYADLYNSQFKLV